MKRHLFPSFPLPTFSALVLLTAMALALYPGRLSAQAPTAEQATEYAGQVMANGDYVEAAKQFEDVVKNYPTATTTQDSWFRLAYLYYLLGKYTEAQDIISGKFQMPGALPNTVAKSPGLTIAAYPNTPPEISEMATCLIPQISAAQAAKAEGEAAQKTGFEKAIKEYDEFLQKHPRSTQVELATYGRSMCYFQVGKYDEAIAGLRDNLKNFPNSETVLDSQYLLALGLMTQGGIVAQKAIDDNKETSKGQPVESPEADKKFAEAEQQFKAIIAKRTDIARLSDAQFQLAELYNIRGRYAADKEKRAAFYAQSLAAYRAILPKQATINAQQGRINVLKERRQAALLARNYPEMKRIDNVLDNERGKLEALKAAEDPTAASLLKVGQLYYFQEAYNEARVIFIHLQTLAEGEGKPVDKEEAKKAEEAEKALVFFTTNTYARQAGLLSQLPPETKGLKEVRAGLVEKAVRGYEEFQQKWKGDKLAEDLPFLIGTLFITGDATEAEVEQSVKYFNEQMTLYPEGRYYNDALLAQTNAFVQQKQFDKAIGIFREFLAKNPKREEAAKAELGIANIQQSTAKTPEQYAEAIAQYQKIADDYSGCPEAEMAAFWVGQLKLTQPTPEYPGAIAAFEKFIKTYPENGNLPAAQLGLGQAYAGNKETDKAMAAFETVAEKWPQSAVAPHSYFQRANLLSAAGKTDDLAALMQKFIATYPESPYLFYAYQTIAKGQIAQKKYPEAIATYNEFIGKYPQAEQSPGFQSAVAALWTTLYSSLGPYFTLPETQRALWKEYVEKSSEAANKLITDYPESAPVAKALQTLLDNQKWFITAAIKVTPEAKEYSDADLTAYFKKLADEHKENPSIQSKILFTLATYTYTKDKAKALEQMNEAYKSDLVYAPEDLDLYGTALLDENKLDEAGAVFEKLARDYPLADPAHPEKAVGLAAKAQVIALYGAGRILQIQGKNSEAAEKFRVLLTIPGAAQAKVQEANYSVASDHAEKRQYKEAQALLQKVIGSRVATNDLRARAMLLYAKNQEAMGDLDNAIDQYNRVGVSYEGIPAVAAEGLWRCAQLLEKQAPSMPIVPADPKKAPNRTKKAFLQRALQAYNTIATKFPKEPQAAEAKTRAAALAQQLK